jgi:ferredoxin
MIVEVDAARCEAAGYCQRLAPHIFQVGDDHSEVIEAQVDGDDLELAEEAINLCPTRAISVRHAESAGSGAAGG